MARIAAGLGMTPPMKKGIFCKPNASPTPGSTSAPGKKEYCSLTGEAGGVVVQLREWLANWRLALLQTRTLWLTQSKPGESSQLHLLLKLMQQVMAPHAELGNVWIGAMDRGMHILGGVVVEGSPPFQPYQLFQPFHHLSTTCPRPPTGGGESIEVDNGSTVDIRLKTNNLAKVKGTEGIKRPTDTDRSNGGEKGKAPEVVESIKFGLGSIGSTEPNLRSGKFSRSPAWTRWTCPSLDPNPNPDPNTSPEVHVGRSSNIEERINSFGCLAVCEAMKAVMTECLSLVGLLEKERRYEEAVAVLSLIVAKQPCVPAAPTRESITLTEGRGAARLAQIDDHPATRSSSLSPMSPISTSESSESSHAETLAGKLEWANNWCSSTLRGYVWNRLSMDLHHLGRNEEGADMCRMGRADLLVDGGYRVSLEERLGSWISRTGEFSETPPKAKGLLETETLVYTTMGVTHSKTKELLYNQLSKGKKGVIEKERKAKGTGIHADTTANPSPNPNQTLTTRAKAKGKGKGRGVGRGRGRLIFHHTEAWTPSPKPKHGRRRRGGGGSRDSPDELGDGDNLGRVSGLELGLGDGRGLCVEEVVLRKKGKEGWKGVKSENRVPHMLLMVLLWEDLFSLDPQGAMLHFCQNRPLDLGDPFFWQRRPKLEKSLSAISRLSDRELWDVAGRCYDRLKDASCAFVSKYIRMGMVKKQEFMEICVSFGGARLSSLLYLLASDFSSWSYGFPDLILWKLKAASVMSNGNTNGSTYGNTPDPLGDLAQQTPTSPYCDLSTYTPPLRTGNSVEPFGKRVYSNSTTGDIRDGGGDKDNNGSYGSGVSEAATQGGLGWEGLGYGWELMVVEVKSAKDVVSAGQKAWITQLSGMDVPCEICRVMHRSP
ncbi:unnamed protein product [Discosporangium mesarthrocarpum]